MEKQFIPYEQALKLKELGFDEPVFGLYAPKIKTVFLHLCGVVTAKEQVPAPLWQQAFDWFRDTHNLTWEHQSDDGQIQIYVGDITYPDSSLEFFKSIEVEYEKYSESFQTARLECLKKLIEIVKQQVK
jgi:hypothetical protein